MTPTALIRTAVALAAALLLGGTLLAVIPAASSDNGDSAGAAGTERRKCNPPRCWIGGAFNVSTGVAYTWENTATREAARRTAKRLCKQYSADEYDADCRAAGTNRHGCLAIAYRASDGDLLQWAHRETDFARRLTVKETRRKAVRRALRAVRGDGEEYVAIADCTGR
ncbi:hypothetical protein HNR19_002737 [Nocardioides thalensis]|uniref:DUF4189 domain-containing protein n=1 Tax=Nocardioides thalensis TaxID=1914755 RepID=A0A853C410_9ACTN|nr:DUF4189 domain-containing protein [Nocardioides thalensis]NYJ02039.1 hypothetical protein [Nocardioides thalensis]